MSQIKKNLKKLREKIFKDTANDEVKIVAVTKTRSINEIKEAISCGVTSVGENKVQEAEKKVPTARCFRRKKVYRKASI